MLPPERRQIGRPQIARLQMIGSAAAGIAHDINNQLTLILNHLDSLEPAAAHTEEAVEQARNAARRCSSLTSSLLMWARGEESGSHSQAFRTLDLNEFLARFLGHVAIPDGIEVLTSVPPGLPAVAADTLELERVLFNLTSNACEAMLSAHGSGTLRIVASPLTIDIIDSGPGIASGLRSRIFEPFYTTKGGEGTGLGLAIVREIMRRSGGSISVGSAPQRGASFRLRFRPAKRAA